MFFRCSDVQVADQMIILQVTDASSDMNMTGTQKAIKTMVNAEFADVEGGYGHGRTNGCAKMFQFACADAFEPAGIDVQGVVEIKAQVCSPSTSLQQRALPLLVTIAECVT